MWHTCTLQLGQLVYEAESDVCAAGAFRHDPRRFHKQRLLVVCIGSDCRAPPDSSIEEVHIESYVVCGAFGSRHVANERCHLHKRHER